MSRCLTLLLLVVASSCGTSGPDALDAGGDGGTLIDAGTDAGTDGGPSVHRIVALDVQPGTLAMLPGEQTQISATASYDDTTSADVSATVTWSSSAPAIADVVVRSAASNDVAVRARSIGVATILARSGAVTSNPLQVTIGLFDGGFGHDGGVDGGHDAGASDAGTRDGGLDGGSAGEVRGVWVTRFSYSSAQDVQNVITSAANAGFNVVFFQIRGNGDVFYHSTLEPWSKVLTGTLGRDPGWDPLQVAIDAAHARGIQLHAYFNVFSAWPCSGAACTCRATQGQSDSCALPEASAAGAPTHWLRAHPDSMVVDSTGLTHDADYFWFSPADAAYRTHVLALVHELLTTYDVDGLHLDRIRYPGSWASFDPASVAAYSALPTPRPTHDDWQRENVSSMVGGIYATLQADRPSAVLSASVWGIYLRLPSCNTSEGFSQYYQDSLGWLSSARIDWLVPMIYWDLGTGCTDFGRLLDGFVASGRGPRIVAGMQALDASAFQASKIRGRIEFARDAGAAGTSIFASAYLDSTGAWSWFSTDAGVYGADVPVPRVTWR